MIDPAPSAEPVDAETDEQLETMRIGLRLRAIRADRGMTILELAAKAGVSSGSISQIERGATNPSISTLQKLRAALGVTLWSFLDSEAEPPRENRYVRHPGERPKIVVGGSHFTKELLSPRDNNQLRFMILTIPPGAQSADVLTGPGDKAGYMMAGTAELAIGNEVFQVAEGDSFQFPSTIPHHLVNRSDREAKLIWIINIRESHL
jgi:transcriptional regulator with XRE-family HTH domain